MFIVLGQHELEKTKASDKTQSMRGASGQDNTARLMAENEKLLKDLKKVKNYRSSSVAAMLVMS